MSSLICFKIVLHCFTLFLGSLYRIFFCLVHRQGRGSLQMSCFWYPIFLLYMCLPGRLVNGIWVLGALQQGNFIIGWHFCHIAILSLASCLDTLHPYPHPPCPVLPIRASPGIFETIMLFCITRCWSIRFFDPEYTQYHTIRMVKGFSSNWRKIMTYTSTDHHFPDSAKFDDLVLLHAWRETWIMPYD